MDTFRVTIVPGLSITWVFFEVEGSFSRNGRCGRHPPSLGAFGTFKLPTASKEGSKCYLAGCANRFAKDATPKSPPLQAAASMPPAQRLPNRPEGAPERPRSLARGLEQAAMGEEAKLFQKLGLEPRSQPLKQPQGPLPAPKRSPPFLKPASARNVAGRRRSPRSEQAHQATFRPGRDWC